MLARHKRNPGTCGHGRRCPLFFFKKSADTADISDLWTPADTPADT